MTDKMTYENTREDAERALQDVCLEEGSTFYSLNKFLEVRTRFNERLNELSEFDKLLCETNNLESMPERIEFSEGREFQKINVENLKRINHLFLEELTF